MSRLRARPRLRATAGAWRLSHDRWRNDVDASLFMDENAGCSDIAMDPKNPRVLFAGMWTLEIHTWGRSSGGPGSGLFKSTDGGVTWRRLTGHGLPTKPVGKVTVAIAPSNPDRVYALIETGDGVPWNDQPTENGQLWRTDDGGDNWTLISRDRNAMGRAHYYSRMAVAPDNDDETYYLTASFAKSIDGGATIEAVGPRRPAATTTTSGSIRRTRTADRRARPGPLDHAEPRQDLARQRLLNAQIYHVTVDNEIPYNVLGNKQDEPSYRGPSPTCGTRAVVEEVAAAPVSRAGCGTPSAAARAGGRPPIPRTPSSSGQPRRDPAWSAGSSCASRKSRRQFRNVEVWPASRTEPAGGEVPLRVGRAAAHLA